MDEEESFAKLLSQSTTAAAPSWNATQADDPWANPFSGSTSSSNPFASPFGTSSAYVTGSTTDPYTSSMALPDSPKEEVSPYVSKLEEDEAEALGQRPDPPSVIAAREQEAYTQSTPMYGDDSVNGADQYFEGGGTIPPPFTQEQAKKVQEPAKKGLPSDLIDEDLLAASDPSASLKKAFVKSAPSAPKRDAGKEVKTESKAYVFTPGKKGGAKEAEKKPEVKAEKKPDVDKEEDKDLNRKQHEASVVMAEDVKVNSQKVEDKKAKAETAEPRDTKTPLGTASSVEEVKESQAEDTSAEEIRDEDNSDETNVLTPTKPIAIPLPESAVATPTETRAATPVPPASPAPIKTPVPDNDEVEPSPSVPFTPSSDRVAVSPLDAPPQQPDYGFQSLSIGASSIAPPPPPPKSPVRGDSNGWTTQATSPPGSKFAAKGWGAVDDDEGLFGRGGPSVRNVAADPWSNNTDTSEGGWGEPGVASLPSPPRTDGTSTVSNSVLLSVSAKLRSKRPQGSRHRRRRSRRRKSLLQERLPERLEPPNFTPSLCSRSR